MRGRLLNYFVTIAAFVGLMVGIYTAGSYVIPEFIREGQEFVKKVSNPQKNPRAKFDELLYATVGKWLFQQKYVTREGELYINAYKESNILDPLEFEAKERAKLVTEWKKGEIADKLESKIEETIVQGMTKAGHTIGELIPKLLYLPFEILLVLLLSFFITIDIPKMKQGLARLRESRIKHFYDEIVPGLYSFGKLMGKSFQAQGVIAAINTLLTYVFCIRLFDIQHGLFLSAVVFICSFIPVVGVVISGIPIAMVAMTQENGSLMISLWAIAAILIVHFAETSFFNPKIVGNMLHLHPVLVLVILAISEHFFKVWGLLLGVPVAVYIIRYVILDEVLPGVTENLTPSKKNEHK